ncbi:MAG: hypothetical protein AAF587_28830 [Bacteroidota bacterium]
MPGFASLQELLSLLNSERKLISALFEKRNSRISENHEGLLALVNDDPDRIHRLIQRDILVRSGRFLELDERLLEFFETFLEVDQEVSVAYVHDTLDQLKKAISYYEDATSSVSKQPYLHQVKRLLRRIDKTLIRNMIALSRNVKHVYQTESNYTIKRKKLEDYREKRDGLETLIQQLKHLIEHEPFFKILIDPELESISFDLLDHLRQVRTSLLEIQQQIILYLSRIRHQSALYEKLQQLKYLKDQFEIREKTNINQVLMREDALLFDQKLSFNLPVALSFFETDEALPIVQKVARKHGQHTRPTTNLAEKIEAEYLEEENQQSTSPDLQAIRNLFLTNRLDLFQFLMKHDIVSELPMDEKIRIFCQLISLYEKDLIVQDTYGVWEGIEYVTILPKTNA